MNQSCLIVAKILVKRIHEILLLFAAVTSAALLMDCSSQDLMSALSSQKIQSDQDIVSKSLTLLQVSLLFKHFTCPSFHGSKCSLFSMCICVLFIYLTISLFHILCSGNWNKRCNCQIYLFKLIWMACTTSKQVAWIWWKPYWEIH